MQITPPAVNHRSVAASFAVKSSKTDRHPFNGLFSRTNWISRQQKA